MLKFSFGYCIVFTVLISYIRIVAFEINSIKFNLIPIINNNQLFWLYKFNIIFSFLILFLLIFKKFHFLWIYFIVEKIAFLIYLLIPVCVGNSCIGCDYHGNYPNFFGINLIIFLNVLFIICALVNLFSFYTNYK